METIPTYMGIEKYVCCLLGRQCDKFISYKEGLGCMMDRLG